MFGRRVRKINMQIRTLAHPNFTLSKIFKFGIASLVGAGIVSGGTYLLTDIGGIYYVYSTVITGAVAFAIKFVINAIWTFKV